MSNPNQTKKNSQYYQESKKSKRNNYEENKKERRKVQRNYYEENKEDHKLYQRKYDESHKERKREYNRLKSKYRQYDEKLYYIFRLGQIEHFTTHVRGWCVNWDICDSHKYCWVEAKTECDNCHKRMFKFKGKSSINKKPFD